MSGLKFNGKVNGANADAVPAASWTIDHALTLFEDSEDPISLKALDTFIETHASIFKRGLPLKSKKTTAEDQVKNLKDVMELRKIRYHISEENKKDAIKIATMLDMDALEVLRVIAQTSVKIPVKKQAKNSIARLGNLNTDDIPDIYESERIKLYTSIILRETKSYIRMACLIIQNRVNNFISYKIQSLGNSMSEDLSFCSNCLTDFKQLIEDILCAKFEIESDSELNTIVSNGLSYIVLELLRLLINVFMNTVIEKGMVLSWFQCMVRTNFLAQLSTVMSNDVFETASGLATIATLLAIDLDSNFGDLSDDISYMNDPETLYEITNMLANTPTNPIVVYAWSFVLHRKSLVIGTYPQNPVGQQVVKKFGGDLENMKYFYNAFAKKAEEIDVCRAIIECHKILKFDSIYVAILGSFIISMLPYVELTEKVASVIGTVLNDAPEHIVKKFFSDENSERLIILSRAKLPVSISSFIKICNINGVFAYEEFSLLKSYMETFNELDLFNKYEFDEHNPELVQFNQDIDVFPPFEKGHELSLLLEKGIKGKLIATEKENEQVVIFLYEYNGLSMIGRVLQNLAKIDDTDNDEARNDLMIDIIRLITKILVQCPKSVQEDTIAVMSAFVDSGDIFSVIWGIFNKALFNRDVRFLIPLVDLLSASLESFSEKVWEYLAQSTFIQNGSRGSAISVVLGAIETVRGDYNFTIAVAELYGNLTANCLDINNPTPLNTREAFMGKLMLHLVQVYESFSHWKYNSISQKAKLGTLISDIFSKTLIAAYGIGETTNVRDKPTGVFALAAEHIVNSFLTSSAKEVRSNRPIISIIESTVSASFPYQTNDAAGVWFDNWTRSSFELATLLITVRSILGFPPSTFERHLFAASKNLVEIYAQYVALRKPVMKLLTSLVSAKWPNEPPSMLAHLGNYHSKILTNAISVDLENEFDDYQMKISIYDFFAAVMDGNFQEGLSIMFITGRDIRPASSEEQLSEKSPSILSILKKQISQIYQYPETVGLHLVEAIALAFNSWTTAKEDGADTTFVQELINRIKVAPKPTTVEKSDSAELISKSYEFKLVSKIAEILALYLFVLKNDECVKLIESLIIDEKFLETVSAYFNISGYEPLIHSDLHTKFETKWPSYKLLQFVKSTLVKTRRYGTGSVYDISLMDELFKQEEEWDFYREHIVSASINLRYIESQITAAKTFGALLTSYCSKASKPLSPQFLKLASSLLRFENMNGISSPIFDEIHKERIELSFFITYKASSTTTDDKLLLPILRGCCNLLQSPDLELISGLADNSNVDYRPVLRTVLVALRMIKPSSTVSSTEPEIFLELSSSIIAKGLKFLLSSIQYDVLGNSGRQTGSAITNNESSIIHKKMTDVILILSIVKAFVKLPFDRDMKLRIAEGLLEHGAIKSILVLYSCSHLIKIGDEPVFADLTLMFVLELISIREVAERFLECGLYSILVESPISSTIQKTGIRPTVSPNYHHIWSDGLLSIALTLLSIFGEKLLSESVMFTGYFIKQIQTNIDSWFDDSIVVTNAAIQETSEIVMFYKALQALNVDEYLVNANNTESFSAVENIRFIPGLDSAEERQGLINVFNYMLSHPKFLSMRVAPITPEESRLFEQDNRAFVDNLIQDIKDLKNALSD